MLDLVAVSRDAAAMLRVLIVDDDPVSLRFLEAALNQLGCQTTAAASSSAALAAAGTAFDLLLLDRNLPDGSGSELLATLRERAILCPAIATSADMTAQLQSELRSAGFATCIEKPVSVARLQEVLQPWLESRRARLLDDESALGTTDGDPNTLRILRDMFVQELKTLQDELAGHRLAGGPLLDRLHRLRASCGFCGTPKLAACALVLEQSLRANPADALVQCEEFLAGCRETIAALSS